MGMEDITAPVSMETTLAGEVGAQSTVMVPTYPLDHMVRTQILVQLLSIRLEPMDQDRTDQLIVSLTWKETKMIKTVWTTMKKRKKTRKQKEGISCQK